jgi:menaquinone-dependent protoporphyrinogen oxidase
MPRLLIAYGTTDGQTAKICDFLADEAKRLGTEVDLVQVGTRSVFPGAYDAVIVAASVYAQGHQRSVIRWAGEYAAELATVPNAFISVCLGVLQKDPQVRRDLDRIQERFVERTGWRPDQVKEVAGALKYTRYGWLKRMAMRYIAGRPGGSTDTSRDHEYTDWADLRQFVRNFLAGCREKPGTSGGSGTYNVVGYEMAARSNGTMVL